MQILRGCVLKTNAKTPFLLSVEWKNENMDNKIPLTPTHSRKIDDEC